MRITQRQAKALEGSVEKWWKIVKGTGVDAGVNNCPLCQLYYHHSSGLYYNTCKGCPVRNDTQYADCRGTPYYRWKDLFGLWVNKKARTKKQKAAAQAMLSYLEDLLARCTVRKGK